ncbi:MAG: zinc ribbon domain-containing protein [Halobacteriales archaeon]|nr:zinc ribbon domain-containing protein [Halobacteriales archaeon]
MGVYVSLPAWRRSLDGRYRLVAGECLNCGERTFPPEGACPYCGSDAGYDEFEPEGTGTVVARTVVEGALPPEFAEFEKKVGKVGVVLVELDEGVRVPGMLTDCDPYATERGDRVEKVVRRLYEQEGVVRYGYKFRPTG